VTHQTLLAELKRLDLTEAEALWAVVVMLMALACEKK